MELERHFNHSIVIAKYSGLDDEPVNYAVECEDCHEVIVDEEVNYPCDRPECRTCYPDPEPLDPDDL